jgi:hypothetical protein
MKKSPKRTCRDLNSRLYIAGEGTNKETPQYGTKIKDSANSGLRREKTDY